MDICQNNGGYLDNDKKGIGVILWQVFSFKEILSSDNDIEYFKDYKNDLLLLPLILAG